MPQILGLYRRAVVVFVLCLGSGLVRAQSAAPPGDANALAAFRAAASLLRGGETPEAWASSWTSPLGGAAVTLRMGGRIVGRGSDMTPGPRAVVLAAQEALVEARRRLPAGSEAALMTIQLELAGPLVPVAVRRYEDIEHEIAPGLDGIALRRGEQTEAIFPGAMLAGNVAPAPALSSLIASVTQDPALALIADPRLRLGELLQDKGLTVCRFRCVQLVQEPGADTPTSLVRGGRIVPLHAVTAQMLRELADGLATHLVRRRWPGPERLGMLGLYDPVQGRHDPIVAPPLEQALAVIALLKYAELGGLDEQNASLASQTAARWLGDLAVLEKGETEPWEPSQAPAVLAACGLLARRGGLAPEVAAMAGRCLEIVRPMYSPAEGWSAALPPARRSLAAYAMVAWAGSPGAPPEDLSWARSALRAVYRDLPPQRLVEQMPWLAWAEIDAAPPAQPLPAAAAFEELRALILSHTITPESAGPDEQDLIGGVVFTRGGARRPTWQSLRAIAPMAAMLADERATPAAQVPERLAGLLPGLRFIAQLSAGDAESLMYAQRDRARHGVRRALWDQAMPVEATAVSLIAVSDALRAIDRAGATRAAP